MKRESFKIVFSVAIAVVVIAGLLYYAFQKAGSNQSSVYLSEEECEVETGLMCSYVQCDYGAQCEDFIEGWLPSQNQPEAQ